MGSFARLGSLLQEAERRGAGWIICDAPPGAAEILIPEFQRNDWCVALDPRMFSELGELGDPIAQRRKWCLASNQSQLPDEEWLSTGAVREFSPPMTQALDEPGTVPEEAWQQRPWELQLDPRVGTVRLHTQPRVLGRIMSSETGQRETVYGMNGPCPTPLRHPTDGKIADRLIRDPKGPGTGVRALRFREYAKLKGVPHEPHEQEPTPVELRALLQAVPLGAATSALVAAQRARNLAQERKAGVNHNPEEEQVQSQMRAWLRAWREGRLLGRECEALQGDDTRAGGYDYEGVPPVGQGALREIAETLGLLDSDTRDNEDSPKVGGPWGGNQGAYEAQLRAEGEALLMEALAEGASKTYWAAWDQWMVYARVRGTDPFFDGQTRKEIRHDENKILLYIVHLGITMSRAAGTVKAKLFALRQMHVMDGYPDPLQGKPAYGWP